ncbi:hypothetical protein AAFC00_002216 [Neodothiora populina]|uniref:Mitochondrial intermembrane space import and assembly protein 40 n=1 Tax=Neodothiora populina TaxID=2781224 RepID=A0ABR3PH19_9PEZI
MFRPTARRVLVQSTPRNLTRSAQTPRFLTTAPPHKTSRSWKNSAVRWTLAGALVYYYNTSNIFAEEPALRVLPPPETPIEPDTNVVTLDAVVAKREARAKAELAAAQRQAEAATPSGSEGVVGEQATPADIAASGSPGELEDEASQQGAFNEETGEINWDCPCLGGMAHGPCGEQFREAFSCFVYSQEEPKGVDCIDKFKNMQNCFREHPDIYGAEIDDDEAPEDEAPAPEGAENDGAAQPAAAVARGEKVADGPSHPDEAQGKTERAQAALKQVKAEHGEPISETDEIVPKAWHESK